MTSPIATSLWTLTLTGTVHTFQVKSVTATLDELNTVYGQATVTVAPYPKAIDDAILAAILAGTKRATLVATRTLIAPTVGTQTRTFDLIVHERVLRADGSVSFELATDEALLEVRGRVATTELDHWIHVSLAGITARAAINRILSLFAGGASLLAGAVDAAVHRLKPSRNLIANGSFEVDIVGWVAFGNASSLTRSTTFALDGVASLRWSATAAGSSAVNTTPIPVTQGRWYKGQVAIRSQVARDAQLYLQTLDSAGTVITSTAALVPSSTSAWSVINHRVYVDDPRVATIRLVVQTNANATGNQHYLDSVILEEIDPATMGTRPSFSKFGADLGGVAERLFYNPTRYWNGSTADTVYYQYDWEGTAHQSFSTRTQLLPREFDLLIMQPGQGARDFLDPIIGLTGGRLFCDESRIWRLVDATYTAPGTLALAGVILNWDDIVSLGESFDGVPTTFTGVVVCYETVATNTRIVTRNYDAAGTETGRVYRKVVQGGYPGPGEAAALLSRAASRDRSIPVTALADLTATPGMAATLTIDGTNYSGTVSRVQWRWSETDDSDTMIITTRDLI